MKKLLSLVLVIALLLSCVVLCAQAEAADAVVRGGTLKVGKTNKLTGFDPSKTSSRNEDGYVYYLLFETLITYDENGNLAPGLATGWSYSEDGLSMTLTLRQGVTFHDGTPFNAEAVKANMDYNTNPDNGHVYLKSELGNIVSTEVIDEYTVKINLSTVDAALPSVFTNICGLMLAPSTLGAEDMAIHPVGTGAFKLEEYVEGDHIFLTAYENYWDKGADGQALPYLDRVEIYIMGDDSVRTINLQTGDIDMVDYHLSGNSIMKAMDMSNVITVMTNNRSTYFLSFNLNDERMGNPLVRQAVSYAVNREELIEVCLEGFGVVDAFDATPDQWFYSSYTPYTYDPEKAKALLEEAGFPDGITIELSYISREPDATMCQLLQEQLKASGITLTLEPLERLAWIDKIKTNRSGEMGIGVITIQGLDPNQQYNSTLAYCDPKCVTEIQQLLLSAKTTFDLEKRREIFVEYQRQYLDDALYVILGQYPRYSSYTTKLNGITYNPNGTFNLKAAWLSK